MPIPGVIAVRALVAKICPVRVAPLVPASPFFCSLSLGCWGCCPAGWCRGATGLFKLGALLSLIVRHACFKCFVDHFRDVLGVFCCAHCGWGPKGSNQFWYTSSPTNGLESLVMYCLSLIHQFKIIIVNRVSRSAIRSSVIWFALPACRRPSSFKLLISSI